MNNQTVLFNSYLSLSGFPNARILHMIQGDKTELEFELKDKNGETVNLNETTGQVQIIDSDTDQLKALTTAEINNGKATFVIDTILPVDEYELYVKIGDYYFPSSTQSFILSVQQAYDVMDVDVQDLQTIDIVIQALSEEIRPLLAQQTESIIRDIIESEPEKFKGEQGEPLRFEDLSDEQVDRLRGEDGSSITFDGLTNDQREAIRGYSAYQLAVQNGYTGSMDSWLSSLKGDKGDKGEPGLSAYSEAINLGFTGTKQQWLESIKGAKGDKGQDGTVSFNDLTEEQRYALRIPPKVYSREEYNSLEEYDDSTIYIVIDE